MFKSPFHSQSIAGRIHQEAFLRTKNAEVNVFQDIIDQEIIFETEGLVVALYGGTYLVNGPSETKRIEEFARLMRTAGGIILNGGLGGSMELSAKAAPENTLGISTPIFHAQENKFGKKAVVDTFITRRAVLTYSPIVVALPGSLGTFNEIIATLLELREQIYFGVFAPHFVFIHVWWQPYLEKLMTTKIIDRETQNRFQFFTEMSEIAQVLKLEQK